MEPEAQTPIGSTVSPANERLFATALAVAAFLASGFAGVAAEVGTLSDSARAQIQALLQEKASWTPSQGKLESQLIHALKRNRGQSFAAGAPKLELEVKAQADGRVLVDINAKVTPELLALIRRGGGEVINNFPQFRAVRALVALAQLEVLAGSEDVGSIRRADEASPNTGGLNSEGDTTHQANSARSIFGTSGTGVKVGVVSDGVQYLANSQASGDLGTVTVLTGQGGAATNSEGTAMLEIIHDLAPGAQLYFATADGGPANFAQNILNLHSSGCSIIVDDVGYFGESPFQDAVIAQAVNTVTAAGALYFSAAGNSGNLDSGTSGTWEGDFVDGGAAVSPVPESGRLHRFGSVTYNTVVSVGGYPRVDLFWADPLGGASTDYDLFVLDSTGASVLRSSITRQTGTQDPYESISTNNVGERIVIVKFSGAARFLRLATGRGRLSTATAGAIFGHAAATNAFGMAAVDVATAYPGPFSGGSANPAESFSSDGPRHVFFNSDGTSMTPGNYLSTGGAIRQKPDLAASDGVATTVPRFQPFYGTSAAAPHAAAIAALLKSYNPGLTPPQLRAIFTSTALDIIAPGVDRVSGAGVLMAASALQAAPPGALFITPGAGFNASGPEGGPFSVSAENFSLTNNGTAQFNWTLVNTSVWLNVSPASGSLSAGGAAAAVTVRLNSASSNLAAGVYAATLRFTNVTSGLGQRRLFTLSVEAPLSVPPVYVGSLLALNPVAYWRLNETNRPPPAGVVSNSGSLGVIGAGWDSSSVLQAQPGIVGTCFRFSNPTLNVGLFGSHVDVPYQATLNPNGPFSVEFWAKPAQLMNDSFSPACSLDTSQNGGLSRLGWVVYQTVTNTFQFRLGGLNGYVATASGGPVQANVWHHIVGVYDGANASIYVNGLLAGGPAPVAAGFSPNSVAPLRFGATTIPNRTYDGWVDEAAFYSTALSATQIAAHHAAATTNNSGYAAQILASHPAGYWRLDEPVYTSPPQSSLPVAINMGSLAPIGNGIHHPGGLPGVDGVPGVPFGANNHGCQFNFPGYIAIPGAYLNLTGPLTLSSWVKANPSMGGSQTILSKGASSYLLTLDESGHPHFANGQPSSDLAGPNRVDDGQWHQLAAVYDGTNVEALYVDGQLVNSIASATAPVLGNGNDLWIGGSPDLGGGKFFSGVIDEVAIFTNVLTAAQIGHLFDTAVAPVFQDTAVTGGNVLLSWSATAGRTYQLQFKTNLNQTAWSNLFPVVAASATASASVGVPSGPRRFYRAVLVP